MDQLLSVDYANELRAMIDPYKTFDDPKHYGAVYSLIPDKGTSQISILGTQGDAVSVTTSINLGYLGMCKIHANFVLSILFYPLSDSEQDLWATKLG